MIRSLYLPAKIWKIYTEDLTGSVTYPLQSLNTTPLFPGHVLGAASEVGKESKMHTLRAEEGHEKPPIARVKLMGWLVVMFPGWSPPILIPILMQCDFILDGLRWRWLVWHHFHYSDFLNFELNLNLKIFPQVIYDFLVFQFSFWLKAGHIQKIEDGKS